MIDPRHAALFRTLTEYGLNVSPASRQLVDHLLVIFDTLADHSTTPNKAADAIDAETQKLKNDGVLEPDKYRPCRDAAEQLREMAKKFPPRTAQTRADILNEAADWLVAKYGVTNRAAGDLRRMADEAAPTGKRAFNARTAWATWMRLAEKRRTRAERAERAERDAATLERVRAECDRIEAAVTDNPTSPDLAGGYRACLRHIRAALDEHQEQP